jgi:membrane-associated phospholipid phosphatase
MRIAALRAPPRLRALACMAVIGVLGSAGVSRADEPMSRPPLRWDPAWTHANVWDYSLTAVGLTTLGLETVFLQNKQEPVRWNAPILFDEAMRDVFRGSTQEVRDDAATASWVLWYVEVGYPLAVDVPHAWIRYGRDVAWDLFWQYATAISLASAVDFAMRDIVARLRPRDSACLAQGRTDCLDTPESTRSFPSGHVAETSTATALICTQHLSLHLYGEPWDAVTCGAAIATDATVGALRLMTDNHYMSDVLAGGALGFLFGWGVPVLMHLHGHVAARDASQGPSVLVVPVPLVLSGGAGLGVAGVF